MTSSQAKSYARSRLGAWDWDDSQFNSLEILWEKESNWNYKAENSSGAVGIPQLKGGKNVPNFMNDYQLQIEHGFSYIKKRYGSPNAAWNHFQEKGWY